MILIKMAGVTEFSVLRRVVVWWNWVGNTLRLPSNNVVKNNWFSHDSKKRGRPVKS